MSPMCIRKFSVRNSTASPSFPPFFITLWLARCFPWDPWGAFCWKGDWGGTFAKSEVMCTLWLWLNSVLHIPQPWLIGSLYGCSTWYLWHFSFPPLVHSGFHRVSRSLPWFLSGLSVERCSDESQALAMLCCMAALLGLILAVVIVWPLISLDPFSSEQVTRQNFWSLDWVWTKSYKVVESPRSNDADLCLEFWFVDSHLRCETFKATWTSQEALSH